MSAERSVSPDQESLARELEYYKRRCSELEKRVSKLGSENKELREKLASLETTVSAVVAVVQRHGGQGEATHQGGP
jgi:predicted RNase H-like nuclease (RuvC/YqgF family)